MLKRIFFSLQPSLLALILIAPSLVLALPSRSNINIKNVLKNKNAYMHMFQL